MTPPEGVALPAPLPGLRRPALAVGALALAVCVAGAFAAPRQFFESYLFACVFWGGLALGCLAVLMLQYATGGAWGIAVRRPLESATRTLPLVLLFFAPLAFGLRYLYAWARPEDVAADPMLKHKALYLNVPFFSARNVVYFAAWLGLAFFLNRWSEEQDREATRSVARRLQLLSSGGLVAYGLCVTFWSVDWIMSLEPRWFSTMYGVLFLAGQALAALAFITAVTVLLSRVEPLKSFVTPRRLNDLGKLMLAFVMFWAYVSFSQYLIIWAGNLPQEIPWYLRRLQGGWGWFGVALIVLHFALPFLLLLPAGANRSPRILASVATFVLAMRVVDTYWLVRPVFSPGNFTVHWMDFAAAIGVGGIWLGVFLGQLPKRRLLPLHDPGMAEALESGAH
jgi:hypothetical protein